MKLGGKWMHKQIVFCAPFICFQGIVDYYLEVGEGSRRESVTYIRHECEYREFVRAEKTTTDTGDSWTEGNSSLTVHWAQVCRLPRVHACKYSHI